MWEAKGLLKTNVENHRLHKKTLEDQSKAIRRKIDETEKEIQEIEKILYQLIKKTKAGRQTEADYRLEVQQLRPRKKQCRSQLSQFTFKLNRIQQQRVRVGRNRRSGLPTWQETERSSETF